METSVIHLNIADFAVAVERSARPGMATTPLIIAPSGSSRAMVYDMSEEAFQEGVRKGMMLKKALRLCRSATILPPAFVRYEQAMKDLIKKALAYSPLVESGTDDGHLFIDVTGTGRLFGPPVDVAWRLNRCMKKEAGLDPVWSVASNKLVAKVATRVVKPVGEYIVGAGEEEAFLAPLPLDLIPGFTPGDLVRLAEFNFSRVSQVHSLDMAQLAVVFEDRAPLIHDRVRGIDPAPVLPVDNRPVIIEDYEFIEDTNDVIPLKRALQALSEQAGLKLRQKNRTAAAVRLILSYSDGIQKASVMRLAPPVANDTDLFRQCLPLLFKAWTRRVRIRYMRLICTRTVRQQGQMSLFDSNAGQIRQDRLARSIDMIRERFGPDSVFTALALSA